MTIHTKPPASEALDGHPVDIAGVTVCKFEGLQCPYAVYTLEPGCSMECHAEFASLKAALQYAHEIFTERVEKALEHERTMEGIEASRLMPERSE